MDCTDGELDLLPLAEEASEALDLDLELVCESEVEEEWERDVSELPDKLLC